MRGFCLWGLPLSLCPHFASCFSLRVELLFPWGPNHNYLLREMATGYNSCYCDFAETLKCLTGLSTQNYLYLNSLKSGVKVFFTRIYIFKFTL